MITRPLVPYFILDKWATDQSDGQFNAVAMFVDLAGFSTLSDSLIRYGKEGIEVLTKIINDIFDPITDEVYARGGFIATFAGDAFTALFPLSQPGAAQQAVLVAQAVQDFVATTSCLQTRLGTFDLGVKVGLDAGEVAWGILGDSHSCTYYFRGPAVDGSARAEKLAEAGQIVCSAELWGLVENQVLGQVLPSNHRLLSHCQQLPRHTEPPPTPSRTQLAPFVPDSILHLQSPAEFRQVCSVFISFAKPEDETRLAAFVTGARELVQIYGGYFNKVDFGDKGSVILALFGAPISYENNSERAVDFLLALRSENTYPPWRAGLTMGTAYAGIVGGRTRCEYTAIGDVVNLGARLMMMAPWGEVYTDDKTRAHLTSLYDFESLGMRSIKGKSLRVAVFALRGKRRRHATQQAVARLVGREEALASLQAWMQPLFSAHNRASGAPKLCLVHLHGEAGMGKTRLLHVLRQQISESHQLMWFTCRADDILRQSLNPFVYVLKHYFRQTADQTAPVNRHAFQQKLADLIHRLPNDHPLSDELQRELERTRSVLAAMVDVRWQDSLYEQLQPKLRFENSLAAFINFIKAQSLLAPVVLEIDGGHLLDEDSLTLMQRLVNELVDRPVALLVASRPYDDGSCVVMPRNESVPWHELTLAPLQQDAVRDLASQILQGDLTPASVQFLIRKTDGNPFFVEQLVQDLRERGAFVAAVDATDTYTLAANEVADVPTTIDAVLISRLDRLDATVRHVVQTAAVVGREFTTPILSLMSETSNLPDLIAAAETQRIWTQRSEQAYTFTQALLRDVAYAMQMSWRLRELHGRAGEAYEQLYADDLSTYYVDLAYHFEKAGRMDKALPYLRQGAERAKAKYQNDMALSLYRRLLAHIADQPSLQASIHESCGDIWHRTGSYDEALASYQTALRGVEHHAGSTRHAADLYRKIASVYVDKGDYGAAQRWLEQAETQLGQDDSVELARVHLLYAGIFYRQGNIDAALPRGQQALAIASRIAARSEQAHGYRLLGTIHTGAGDLAAAEQDYLASLELCRELGDLRQQSMAYNSLGAVYYYLGACEESEQHYRQSLDIAEKIGFVDQQATVSNNLGELYLLQGRFSDAEARFQDCLRTWQRTGFLVGVSLSYRNLAQIAAYHQEWQTAQAYLDESLATVEKLGSRDWLLAEIYRLQAEVCLGQGEQQNAWAFCRQALAIANEQNIKLVQSNALRVQGQLYRSEGDWAAAEAALRQSLHLAKTLGQHYEQGLAWYELALLYRAVPDPDQMQVACEKAAAIFHELEATWHLARVNALGAAAS